MIILYISLQKTIEGPIKMLKDIEFLFPKTKSRETLRFNKVLREHVQISVGDPIIGIGPD